MSASVSSWKRNQAAVTVATFIGFTGFTLVMPFLPLYLQQLGEHDVAAISVWSGLSLGITPLVTAMMTTAIRTAPASTPASTPANTRGRRLFGDAVPSSMAPP